MNSVVDLLKVMIDNDAINIRRSGDDYSIKKTLAELTKKLDTVVARVDAIDIMLKDMGPRIANDDVVAATLSSAKKDLATACNVFDEQLVSLATLVGTEFYDEEKDKLNDKLDKIKKYYLGLKAVDKDADLTDLKKVIDDLEKEIAD